MRNAKLRIKAMKQYAEDALRESEEILSKRDDPEQAVTEAVAYAGAYGRLDGVLQVIINDCKIWLEEMGEKLDDTEPMPWERALGESRN